MLWLLHPLHPEEQSLHHSFLTEGGAEQKQDEILKRVPGARGLPMKSQNASHLNPQKRDD